jgi:hypothetical protein
MVPAVGYKEHDLLLPLGKLYIARDDGLGFAAHTTAASS